MVFTPLKQAAKYERRKQAKKMKRMEHYRSKLRLTPCFGILLLVFFSLNTHCFIAAKYPELEERILSSSSSVTSSQFESATNKVSVTRKVNKVVIKGRKNRKLKANFLEEKEKQTNVKDNDRKKDSYTSSDVKADAVYNHAKKTYDNETIDNKQKNEKELRGVVTKENKDGKEAKSATTNGETEKSSANEDSNGRLKSVEDKPEKKASESESLGGEVNNVSKSDKKN